MGLMNFLKKQFVDIVEWPDETPGVLVHRFERADNEIKNNAKLIVRPGQMAVFVNEGKIADKFNPGTYILSTKNLPILTDLLSISTGFESWHKAEVYFIKTTEQLDIRWGTPQPVVMRDADFGMIRLRAFGNYSYHVGLNNDLISKFVGAQPDFTTEQLENQITSKIVSQFSDALGEMKIPALDIAAQYTEIGEAVLAKMQVAIAPYGLELSTFTVINVNLPDYVNEAIDRRGAAGAFGGNVAMLNQVKAGDAMLDAANNQGGSGNIMGMMMGGQMGGMVAQGAFMQQPQQPQQAQQPPAAPMPPPPPAAPTFFLAVNGQQQGPFTTAQLQSMAMHGTFNAATMVWTAGMASWQAASTVPALSAILGSVPPPMP